MPSFQKLALIATPLVVLVTGILPMNTFGWNFAARFVPYFLLGLWANTLLSRGYSRYFDTERFNILKAFAFVRASTTLIFARPLQFKVTRKAQLEDRARELRLTIPYVLVMIASVGAIAWAIRTEAFDTPSTSVRLALVLTALWAVYNAGVVALVTHAVLGRAHRRNAYRFDVRVPVEVRVIGRDKKWRSTETGDVNPAGLSFFLDEELSLGQQVEMRLRLTTGTVVRRTAVVMNSHPSEEGRCRIGARFIEIAEHDRNHLTLALFGGDVREGQQAALKAA